MTAATVFLGKTTAMNRKALVIELSEYDNSAFMNLPGAAKDAIKISGYLSQGLPEGSRFDVEVMRNPTAGEVGAKLRKLAPTLDERSVFALFFIGRGIGAGERKTLTIKGVEYAFRWIPAGSFMMGSSKKEQEAAIANAKTCTGDNWEEEKAEIEEHFFSEVQHKVNVSRGFWMLETEVTREMWASVTGDDLSDFDGSKRLPICRITWDEFQEYVKKLNELGICPEGYEFSLPTEAEWEYACRAGTTTAYHFGESLNGDKANCNGDYPFGMTTKGPNLREPKEVGSYPANAWGLADMHGNVWEWTLDRYGAYPTGEVTDPRGASVGSNRVVRGGSGDVGAVICRAALRHWTESDDGRYDLGARLALRPTSR